MSGRQVLADPERWREMALLLVWALGENPDHYDVGSPVEENFRRLAKRVIRQEGE